MSSVANKSPARGSTSVSAIRPRRAYSRRITSSESNSPRVGDDPRHGVESIENGAKALPRAGFGHEAIRPRGTEQARQPAAVGAHLGVPGIPRVAHARIPRGHAFPQIVVDCIQRTAERVIAR
jgi:hypothetical protein